MASAADGKVVLITGANRGIGRETAHQLGRRGFHVIIGGRDASAGQQVVREIQDTAGRAAFLRLDVSDSASIRSAATELARQVERLDVLINNAAIYPDRGVDILTVSREHMNRTFQTNVFGALEVAQAFLPLLRKSAAGRIINLSSGYGQLEGMSPNVPSYCLSKLAINGLTIMLSQALQEQGIAVNSMCPGWVRTEMGGPNAPRSVEQGADTAIWLAAEAPQELTGKFFRDRQQIPW